MSKFSEGDRLCQYQVPDIPELVNLKALVLYSLFITANSNVSVNHNLKY